MDNDNKCSTCVKEKYNKVPVSRILEKLDGLFSTNDLEAAERLLEYWENEAVRICDDRGLLEILNEEIGFYRRVSKKDKALKAVYNAFDIINKFNDPESVSFATVYLNGATTLKAFGRTSEAMPYYMKAKSVYDKKLAPNDYMLAAFYNNISSAYKDLEDFDKCEESCIKAIEILRSNGGYLGEIAVTLINLAHLYYERDPFNERTYEFMDEAFQNLMSDKNEHDGNFAFICSKCYPSFGFFGYFEREAELKSLMEKIYEGT